MPRLKDYTGLKYNYLTFLEFSERKNNTTYWKVRCDCGNEVVVPARHVVDGSYLSCGCIRWKDYTGQKHGKLTFVERIPNDSIRTSWKLQCDCGREIIAMASNVIGGGTRSCGCVRRHGAKTFITGILSNYTRHAVDRGFAFELSRDTFIELIHQPCFYCGEIDSNTWINRRTGEQYLYNGIDRVDNSKGYTEGNVVPCCAPCNWSKSDRSLKEYIAWARKIVAYQDGKTEPSLVNNLFNIKASK